MRKRNRFFVNGFGSVEPDSTGFGRGRADLIRFIWIWQIFGSDRMKKTVFSMERGRPLQCGLTGSAVEAGIVMCR